MEKNRPLISVVVPVYNVRSYIEQCIDLLKKQSYENIEVILVDDGSTDSSGRICDLVTEKDDRFRVIHKSNGGLSDARNVGIENSRGEYITCIDSDDIITNNYVEVLVNGLSEDCDVSIGAIEGIFDKEQEKRFFQMNNVSSNNVIPRIMDTSSALSIMLLQSDFDVSACAKMYKKSLFDTVKYPYGQYYEDLATTYKLIAKSRKISFSPVVIYGYRQNRDGSITSQRFNEKSVELIKSFEDFYSFIKCNYPELLSLAECRYASCASGVLCMLYLSGQRREYTSIEKECRNKIIKRAKYILMNNQMLLRRKIKILASALGETPYRILHRLYFNNK